MVRLIISVKISDYSLKMLFPMGQTSTKPYLKTLITSLAILLVFMLPAISQAQVQVIATGTNVTCNGLHNGTATANPSGGWFPYTFLWSNGATTQTITNLQPGTYCVTVTDIDAGTGSDCVTISEPAALGVTVFGQSQICGNAPDGWAAVTPNNGTPPYTYLWTDNSTGTSINNLDVGNYSVTITDDGGCQSIVP